MGYPWRSILIVQQMYIVVGQFKKVSHTCFNIWTFKNCAYDIELRHYNLSIKYSSFPSKPKSHGRKGRTLSNDCPLQTDVLIDSTTDEKNSLDNHLPLGCQYRIKTRHIHHIQRCWCGNYFAYRDNLYLTLSFANYEICPVCIEVGFVQAFQI